MEKLLFCFFFVVSCWVDACKTCHVVQFSHFSPYYLNLGHSYLNGVRELKIEVTVFLVFRKH